MPCRFASESMTRSHRNPARAAGAAGHGLTGKVQTDSSMG